MEFLIHGESVDNFYYYINEPVPGELLMNPLLDIVINLPIPGYRKIDALFAASITDETLPSDDGFYTEVEHLDIALAGTTYLNLLGLIDSGDDIEDSLTEFDLKLSGYIIDRRGDLSDQEIIENPNYPKDLTNEEKLIYYSPNSIDLELSVEQIYDDSNEDNPVLEWLVSGDLDFSSATRFWYKDIDNDERKFGVIAASIEVEEFEDVNLFELVEAFSEIINPSEDSQNPNPSSDDIWTVVKEGIWPDADSDDTDFVKLTLEVVDEDGKNLLNEPKKTYSDKEIIDFIMAVNEHAEGYLE